MDYKVYPSDNFGVYCFWQDPKTKNKTLVYWQEGELLLPSKTFGYLQDYYIFESMNLAKGADITNTIILSVNKTNPNPHHLNYHKIIDFLGDLYTTAVPYFKGIFYLHNPTHTKNNILSREIYQKYCRGGSQNDKHVVQLRSTSKTI